MPSTHCCHQLPAPPGAGGPPKALLPIGGKLSGPWLKPPESCPPRLGCWPPGKRPAGGMRPTLGLLVEWGAGSGGMECEPCWTKGFGGGAGMPGVAGPILRLRPTGADPRGGGQPPYGLPPTGPAAASAGPVSADQLPNGVAWLGVTAPAPLYPGVREPAAAQSPPAPGARSSALCILAEAPLAGVWLAAWPGSVRTAVIGTGSGNRPRCSCNGVGGPGLHVGGHG